MVFNAYGRLKTVFLCKPTYYEICAFSAVAQSTIAAGHKADRAAAESQHAEFTSIFKDLGISIEWMEAVEGHPDLCATRDFGVNTCQGILIGNFRYSDNEGDDELAIAALADKGIQPIGRVAEGPLEGGDCWYLDEKTMVIGTGNRSTPEGIRGAEKILKPHGIEVLPVEFEEKWNHLDMIMSVVAPKTIMLCPEALPADFMAYLQNNRYDLLEVPAEQVFKGAVNVLALGDGKVMSFAENTYANDLLKAHGFTVYDPPLSQFIQSGTGPHCLSFELEREKD